MQYSWYWVVVFLQFVALLIGFAGQFNVHKAHLALVGVYGTVTALWWGEKGLSSASIYVNALSPPPSQLPGSSGPIRWPSTPTSTSEQAACP